MKKRAITFGLVLAAVVVGGVSGIVSAEIAVAAYISIVALTATMLTLTSRPAPAPVGYVPLRRVAATSAGIVVRAAAGAAQNIARA